MPDVGILNLQIHDNSSTAAEGLGRLATKLEEVKRAVSGMRLNPVATGIKKINDELKNVQPSAIYKLKQLADVLEKISNISGNVGGIRIAFGGRGQSAEDIAAQMQAARDAVSGANADFDQLKSFVQEASDQDEALSKSIDDVQQSVNNLDFSVFDPAKLPIGMLGRTMNESVREVHQLGDAVKDSFEEIKNAGMLDNVYSTGEIEESANAIILYNENVANSWESICQQMAAEGRQVTFKSIEEAARYLGITVDDVKAKLQQTYDMVYGSQPQMQIFSSAEESANALGISLDEVKQQCQQTYDMVYGTHAEASGGNGSIFEYIEEAETARTLLDMLRDKVRILQEEIDTGKTEKGTILSDKAIVNNEIQVERLRLQIEQLQDRIRAGASINGADFVNNLGDYTKIDLLTMKLNGMQSALASDINANKIDAQTIAERSLRINDLAEKIEKLKNAQGKTTEETHRLHDAFKNLKGRIENMFPSISKLLNRFKQLVKYRMLRAIIKQIAEGFREGYENYYRYSEAIGSGFAPAMDSAASALLQMKNSIGAAAAPLIQSLIPYLQIAVNWFIQVVNWANQFVALLRGQATWSRATTQSAKAFESTEKAAKGAGAAIKDLLADWDELNIIQSEGGGGGSGTGADTMTDYLNMFEEVAEFDNDIKHLADGIKNQFGSILNLATEIGLALLGWKFASTFTGVLGALGGLVASGAIIDLEFKISEIFNGSYLKTGKVGWLIADALTTLVGGFLMNKVLAKVLGTGVGKIAIPLILAVTALAGVKTLLGNNDVSALSKEALVDSAYNALKVGGVGAYLLKNAGYSLGEAIGGGAGLAVTTMGIIIGLKAVADTVDTGEITQETVKANFLSAGLVGAGLMIGEAVLGGTAGTIMTVGGIGAVATLGALFAVEALLTLNKGEGIAPVQWGDYNATEEEIRAFIDNEVFSGAPNVEIDLANATFNDLGDKKTELQTAATKVIGTLQSVRLGLASGADADLRKEIETFTETFNSTSTAYQDAIKVSVSLVPVNGSKTDSESILDNSDSRWGELNGIMRTLATDLTEQFGIAYDESLDDVTRRNAEESIRKISDMMSRIADAVASGQVQAKVAHNINTQIGDLTQKSMGDMLKYYEEQRDALVQELIDAGNKGAEGLLAEQYMFERMAEYALKDAGYNYEDETYKHYIEQAEAAKADYESRLKTLVSDAERVANETLGSSEGAKKIRDALLEPFAEKINLSADELFTHAGIGDLNVFKEYIQGILDNVSSSDIDVNDTQLREELADVLWAVLYDTVGGKNIDEYESAIRNGVIGYGDIFGDAFISGLIEGFGTGKTEEGKQIIGELIAELFPDYSADIAEAAKDMAEQVNEEVQEAFENAEYVQADVIPDVHVDNTSANEIREKVQQIIGDALAQGMDGSQLDALQGELIGLYGIDVVESVLEDFENGIIVPVRFVPEMDSFELETDGIELEFYDIDPKDLSGRMRNFNPNNISASGGVTDFNPNSWHGYGGETQIVIAQDDQEQQDNTAAGVKRGNADMENLAGQILTFVERISRKDFTVNITPSSGWGRHNVQSNRQYSYITGDIP